MFKELDRYFLQRGRKLFPLKRRPSGGDPGRKCQEPLHNGWRNTTFTPTEIQRYADRDHGFGWNLGVDDAVVDVDPRNGGQDSLRKLESDLGIGDFTDLGPTVVTGGGGYHVYFTYPRSERLRTALPKDLYPGIDLRRHKNYVVVPGSMHPSGNRYDWDHRWDSDVHPADRPLLVLPRMVVALCTYSPADPETGGDVQLDLTPESLRVLLGMLPVEGYRSNDEWLPLLMAAHYATGGSAQAREVFISWSVSDPEYRGHAQTIGSRWNSLRLDKSKIPVTARTLIHEVIQHGGDPWVVLARQDLEDSESESFDSDLAHPPHKSTESQGRTSTAREVEGDKPSAPSHLFDQEAQPAEPAEPETPARNGLYSIKGLNRNQSLEVLRSAVRGLPENPKDSRLIQILTDAATLGVAPENAIRLLMAKQLGLSQGRLTPLINRVTEAKRAKQRSAEERVVADDTAAKLARYMLRREYDGGKHLIHAPNQMFYYYTGTHWGVVKPNFLKRQLVEAGQIGQSKGVINKDEKLSTLVTRALGMVEAYSATRQDLLRFTEMPHPVINTRTAELWIDTGTGRVTSKPHDPENYLLHCLNTDYDPDATCPLFDETLEDLFCESPNPGNMIRHLWEVIGYVIQPVRDLTKWFMLHGGGRNGKSTVKDVMLALIKKSAVNRRIGGFDSNKNKHAFEPLPGKLAIVDDDVKINAVLPDDALKLLSGNTELEADPKWGTPFEFINCAVPFLLCNSYPTIHDMTLGTRRRVQVIPFKRKFEESEVDRKRSQRIIENELPGVINRALEGLYRLRQRDGFNTPIDCIETTEAWLRRSNPVYGFLHEKCKQGPELSIDADSLFAAYREWSRTAVGGVLSSSSSRFVATLEQLEIKVYKGIVFGVSVDDTPIDDF